MVILPDFWGLSDWPYNSDEDPVKKVDNWTITKALPHYSIEYVYKQLWEFFQRFDYIKAIW